MPIQTDLVLGKNKQDIIRNMLRRIQTDHQNRTVVEKTLAFMQSTEFPDPALLHSHYRNHFNLVDLADRLYYKENETHGNHCWRSKMLFSIMRLLMVNVWCLACQTKFEKRKVFRSNLAKELQTLYI
jgi:hypothetical protein